VGERIQDYEPLDPLGMRDRVTERHRAAERLTEQRHAAAARCHARDLGMQVGDEIVHRLRVVAQTDRRDPEALFESRDLPVEKLTGAIDARHQDEVFLHRPFSMLLSAR